MTQEELEKRITDAENFANSISKQCLERLDEHDKSLLDIQNRLKVLESFNQHNFYSKQETENLLARLKEQLDKSIKAEVDNLQIKLNPPIQNGKPESKRWWGFSKKS